ncbi:hypothetical protein WA026_000892 [Henosepilachna vigintioctopunctata]|uniref:Uncharacterized protein n=1 Tax=Henosepilachna vigintioctopunctata TaxID=420089 RepID=A0AAW1V000_9CUCU
MSSARQDAPSLPGGPYDDVSSTAESSSETTGGYSRSAPVILAILSYCSGFRIDSLTMTDYSNRNYPMAPLPSEHDMNRVYAVVGTRDEASQLRHRIRHHHRATRAHNGDAPRRIRKNRPASSCPKQDISQKAYLANTVVVARTEAVSVKARTHKYSVLFKVQRKLKSPSAFPIIDDYIKLSFLNETSSQRTQHRCVPDRNPSKLVRANIQQSREYLLFLNSYGAHNYTPIGSPELIRRHKLPKVVEKITKPNFSKLLIDRNKVIVSFSSDCEVL